MDLFFVGMQFVLFAFFILAPKCFGTIGIMILTITGFAITGIGIILIVLAILQLNRNLTVFPTPKKNGTLVTHGVFALVRHPIYSGIIALSFGVALIRTDFLQLCIAISLLIFFEIKSGYEEVMLERKFSEYINYKNKTGKLFPKLFK